MDQNYDFNFGSEDSACPPNYRPNPAKPPIEKNYYKSPKKIKSRSKTLTSRPEWISDIDSNRKQSINSVISTVDLHETEPPQTFKTINPARNMREPSKPSPSSKNNRSSSLPSLALKSPNNKQPVEKDYSYLDKYKPPPQYMTNRERAELLRIRQEKERNNNNNSKYEINNSYRSEPKPSDNKPPSKTFSKSDNSKQSYKPPSPKKVVKQEKNVPRQEASKIYSVPNKKVKSNTLDAPRSKSEPTSKASSRNSSTSNGPFSDLNGLKSATLSVASTASNFSARTKVITFNDKKQSLGSIGMATITKLENNFKVRQFPDGPKQGLSNAVKLMESDDWEKSIEGLEMLASLANQHAQVMCSRSHKS